LRLSPALDRFKLRSIVNNGDTWDAKIKSDSSDTDYSVSLFHYANNMGLISISNNVNNKLDYSFIIPESLYTTYREANKKLTDDFSKAISSSENSTNELTKDEAVQLANKYVTGSNGANAEPFKFNTKNSDTYYLKTDVKKDTDGSPDIATYATVDLVDDNNVHITAGVWPSTTASHLPFYDKVVPR